MSPASLADLQSSPSERPPLAPPRRWLTRYGLPLILIAGMGGLLAASAWGALRPAKAVEAEPVIEKTLEGGGARAGSSVVQAAGWIEADPYLHYATSLADGVVEEVFVLEGDRVSKGDLLARLNPRDATLALRRAQAALAQSEAALRDTEVRLRAAQETWDNPVELQRAVDSAKAELDEARAAEQRTLSEITATEADAEQALSDYDRIKPLGESQTVSEQEVIDARTRWEAAEARSEALRRQRVEYAARIERAEANLLAAREALRLRTADQLALGAAEAAVDRARADREAAQAALEEAQLRLDRMEVVAPVDGVVVERFKEPGTKVMLGMDDKHSASIVSLYRPEDLQVRVDVPLVDASLVAVGQPCEIVVDVLPDVTFQGTVTRLLHVADIQKNTLQAKVAVENPRPELRPEMLARVKFLEFDKGTEETGTGTETSAILLPQVAVRDGAVWTVTQFDGEHGAARRVPIETGRERDGWIEAVSGLSPGALVITSTASTLEDGDRVRVTLSGKGNN